MRRIVSISILILYLVSFSGILMSFHFCGGKLSNIDFFSDASHQCSCGKKAMKPNCCKDKTVLLKANDGLAKTETHIFKISAPKLIFTLVNQVNVLPSAHFQFVTSDFFHPPPFKPKASIHIFNGVFLI